jgi:hypothetical protein
MITANFDNSRLKNNVGTTNRESYINKNNNKMLFQHNANEELVRGVYKT